MGSTEQSERESEKKTTQSYLFRYALSGTVLVTMAGHLLCPLQRARETLMHFDPDRSVSPQTPTPEGPNQEAAKNTRRDRDQ